MIEAEEAARDALYEKELMEVIEGGRRIWLQGVMLWGSKMRENACVNWRMN